MKPRIVLDTNVLVSGLISREGSSFRVLESIGVRDFDICVSTPLILEYEEVLKRKSKSMGLSATGIRDVLDYLCRVGIHQNVYFLWRPHLKDVDDDMVLELAVASNADFIVTFNETDFVGADLFGVQAVSPSRFLAEIGEIEWAP